jgi:hypothetical protein
MDLRRLLAALIAVLEPVIHGIPRSAWSVALTCFLIVAVRLSFLFFWLELYVEPILCSAASCLRRSALSRAWLRVQKFCPARSGLDKFGFDAGAGCCFFDTLLDTRRGALADGFCKP